MKTQSTLTNTVYINKFLTSFLIFQGKKSKRFSIGIKDCFELFLQSENLTWRNLKVQSFYIFIIYNSLYLKWNFQELYRQKRQFLSSQAKRQNNLGRKHWVFSWYFWVLIKLKSAGVTFIRLLANEETSLMMNDLTF